MIMLGNSVFATGDLDAMDRSSVPTGRPTGCPWTSRDRGSLKIEY